MGMMSQAKELARPRADGVQGIGRSVEAEGTWGAAASRQAKGAEPLGGPAPFPIRRVRSGDYSTAAAPSE